MKVRGRCYCEYISFEADIQPDKRVVTGSLILI
jgi:hypothetical protein